MMLFITWNGLDEIEEAGADIEYTLCQEIITEFN